MAKFALEKGIETMKRNIQIALCTILALFVLGSFTDVYGEYKYTCKYAVELFSGTFKSGESLPPVYPEVWQVAYPRNVYFAPDADKQIKKDFGLDTLITLSSNRIAKKADDTIMFLDSKVELASHGGWKYAVRSKLRFGRQIEKLDNIIYNENGEIYPFSLNMIIKPTVLYVFRADSTSNEAFFLFFSYTLHDNFPKSLLKEFSQDKEFENLGYDPFTMQIPNPATSPELIFQAKAEYPPHLLKTKRSDKVKLMLLIDRDGTVVRSEIIEKAKYTFFDLNALDASFKCFCKPGLDENGNTTPSWIEIEYVFDAEKESAKQAKD